MTTREERQEELERAGYNLFNVPGARVLVDLLTDSGTGAMSSEQWAGLQRGDESYAGSASWFRFRDAVQELFPFEHVVPTHQGRAAEKILFSALGGPGKTIPNNTHFDTTRANVEFTGAEALDLPVPEALVPSSRHPFKGDMDVEALRRVLAERDVPVVFMTLTNNSGGGQPVSMANLRAVREACDEASVPLFLDACRFAENAWFVKLREDGYADTPVPEIVRETAALADGMTMSAKKDPLGNIGGWLALNDDALAEQCRNLLILTEGFPTYGGHGRPRHGSDRPGPPRGGRRGLPALPHHLDRVPRRGARIEPASRWCCRWAGTRSTSTRAAFLSHIPPLEYPGQALAVALYLEGGIRGCEIGTVMFGRQPDGSEQPAPMDLVRLAIPRRTYTQSHVDYVIEVCEYVAQRASELRGLRIVEEPPALRHFTARFVPLTS